MQSEGAKLRDAGVELAASAQEEKSPGWSARAYAAILTVARSKPTVHVDDVLAQFEEKPAHPNAWGSVWVRAIREKVLARTGRVAPCVRDAGKRAHNYPVYQSLVVLAPQASAKRGSRRDAKTLDLFATA